MTREWIADVLSDYELTVLPLPAEDDGALVGTVVRKFCASKSRTAFVYVHGYVDYFFHEHVADAVRDAGMDFYAIELRRYGRSLRGGNRPNYCTDLAQYFEEITQAIDISLEDGHDHIVLYGHSTGGLIASLYADHGARRAQLSAVVLNSPFFEFDISRADQFKLRIAVVLGRFIPWFTDGKGLPPHYGRTIHASERGEWHYNLQWKPINGFPTYFGWARAITQGHARVQSGLNIQCPVLVLHSDASRDGDGWNENSFTRDIVLDVNDMRKYSAGLGTNVTRTEIPNAIHDVMLSRVDVRENALQQMVQWLHTNVPAGQNSDTSSLA